jgi:hypothetical protein
LKNILIIFGLLICLNTFAQKKNSKNFNYESQQISYSEVSFTDKNIIDFFIVMNDDSKTTNSFQDKIIECKHLKNSHSRFYFLTIPENCKTLEQKEKLFLEFASTIQNRAKLIDSNLYIISDKDYTGLYIKTSKKNNH